MARLSRARAIAAGLFIVLATLLTTPAVVAYWGQRTLTDTERYVETVGPLVDSPEVRTAIAAKVTTALENLVEVEAVRNEASSGAINELPGREGLVRPLADKIHKLIEKQVRAFLASDGFADFWITANTRLQRALVRILEGNDTGAVSQRRDQVVLDVSEVIDQVKERLVDRGLTFVRHLPTPEQDRQIVLLDASQVERARTVYAVLIPVGTWMIAVVTALYVAAVVLSRRRPRMAVIIGLVLAANSLLLEFALSEGRQLFVNGLSGTDFGPASTTVYDTLLSFLMRSQRMLLWLGLLVVVVGWYLGRNAFGTAVRTRLAGGLTKVGLAVARTPAAAPGRWVATHVGRLRVVIAVFGGVVLLWGNDVSGGRLLWSLALVVVALALVQVLVGAGSGSSTPQPEVGGGTPPDPIVGG